MDGFECLTHHNTMKLLPLAWIEKSIDRRVNAWCQKNRWTKLRINSEGLWVAIPPGETEHMEVPPVAYVSQSQLKLRVIRPYLPFIALVAVIVGGYIDLSWQLRTVRQKNDELSRKVQIINQDIQSMKQRSSVQKQHNNAQKNPKPAQPQARAQSRTK